MFKFIVSVSFACLLFFSYPEGNPGCNPLFFSVMLSMLPYEKVVHLFDIIDSLGEILKCTVYLNEINTKLRQESND